MPPSQRITPEQQQELERLCRATGEMIEPDLSRDQARARIETLRTLRTLPCR